MGKRTLFVVASILLGLGALAFIYQREARRLSFATSLFTGVEQYENFSRIEELFPTHRMRASVRPVSFPAGRPLELPPTFSYEGEAFSVDDFLEQTDTGALLVLQSGQVRFEKYWLTGGRDVRWLSMSVAKSFISSLIGIAVEEGAIGSIQETVTNYVPELQGSAYDGVRIKDILQMSSGAAWDETYGDPDSDINRFGRILAIGGSLNEFATTLAPGRAPGTFNHYNSTDTQVLGWLLVRATGRPIADYMEEKLWQPLGMENDGFWMVDSEGMEMAFGGLNATARDYAKLGELYRNGGVFDGKKIVPADWVQASITPDAPHLIPGPNDLSDWSIGYGYQWWIPESDVGEFTAIGVYNQFIYVNPAQDLVIVKLSANNAYATKSDGSADQEFETIEFFRAIAARAGRARLPLG